jgi:hypothetical protein
MHMVMLIKKLRQRGCTMRIMPERNFGIMAPFLNMSRIRCHLFRTIKHSHEKRSQKVFYD